MPDAKLGGEPKLKNADRAGSISATEFRDLPRTDVTARDAVAPTISSIVQQL